jgi:hypothetical protein
VVQFCSSEESVLDDKIWNLLSDKQEDFESNLSIRLSILNLTLQITKQFISVYEKLPSSREIFLPVKEALESLKIRGDWPEKIMSSIEAALTSIEGMKQRKEMLSIQTSNKPKILKLYEPLVEEEYV